MTNRKTKYSIMLTETDFQKLKEIKHNLHLATAQQAIQCIIFTSYSLNDLVAISREFKENELNDSDNKFIKNVILGSLIYGK